MTVKATDPEKALVELHQEWVEKAQAFLREAQQCEKSAVEMVREADENRLSSLEAQQVADRLKKLLPVNTMQATDEPKKAKGYPTPPPPADGSRRKRMPYYDDND